jgi:hypothetical protein
MANPFDQFDEPKSGNPFNQFDQPKKKTKPNEYEPSLGEKVSQGALNILGGTARGAGSFGATLAWPMDKLKDAIFQPNASGLTHNEERRQSMDDALDDFGVDRKSLGFKGAKLGTEIAGTLGAGGAAANGLRVAAPALANTARGGQFLNAIGSGGFSTGAPAAATFGGRMVDLGVRAAGGAFNGGVSAGMIDPKDAKMGAAIGGALPVAMKAVKGVGSALGGTLAIGDRNRELARTAINKYEIPLGYGDIADGNTAKAVRSILNDAPITGGIGAAQRENVQGAFNQAVGKTFGAQGKSLTPDVLDVAKNRMGAEFDRLWNQNALNVDAPMINKMVELQAQAAKLPKSEGASLNAEINDLFGKMQTNAGGTFIPGDVANKFQSYLRRRAEGSAGLKNELGDLRQEIIQAFNRGISPADAAALTLTREQYKAFKTIEPLLNKGEAGVAGRLPGDVPAALLSSAVAKNYPRAAGGPLTELSQIGSRFLVDRVAKTGGSTRAAIQNTGIGAALMGVGATNPMAAIAAIPAAAGLQGAMGNPALARWLVRSPPPPSGLLGWQQAEQLGYRAAPFGPAIYDQ